MRVGFNPRLQPFRRMSVAEQLQETLHTGQRLEFAVVEVSVDEVLYRKGLWDTFTQDVLKIITHAPLQFQLNIFADEGFEEAPSDVTPIPRSVYLRRLVQTIEFFEAYAPMSLYVVHAGRRKRQIDDHLQALYEAFQALQVLFPGVPLAIENGGRESVLHFPDDFLTFLDAFPSLRFVMHTGRAFQSVMWDNEQLARYVRKASRFVDRLAAIRWTNANPVTDPDRPLQLELDRAPDFPLIMQGLGRNPALVHLLDAVGGRPAALARERRALHAQVNRWTV
ncbi:MAG: hypothetical protein OXE05_14505 [Chloroflexi bacterium]|nr:hypothetical protein [Chloroflexota bacterium]